MTAQGYSPTRPLVGGVGIVAIGIFVALVTVGTVTLVSPVKAAFALGGLVLLLPAFVVRDARAYGLFLLTFAIPVEIVQHTTKWVADPYALSQQYGLPATGTLGVDLYVADFLLIVMLLPWLAELSCRRRSLYFPKIGYLFVLYLASALLGALTEAPSFYLAIFEWCRQVLYFVFFLYIINNVVTATQFRAVVLALFVGLALESVIVIVFFQLGIGAEFANLQQIVTGEGGKTGGGILPVAESGDWSNVKRSTGTFLHPAMTAYYLGYILPIAGVYLATARRRWTRILFGAVFVAGCLALLLTFSRAGMLGLIGSIAVFFPLARRSGLISRQTFVWCGFIAVMAALLSTPLLISFLASRPEAFAARLELIAKAEATYLRHPILGGGLNNSSALMEGSHGSVSTQGGGGSTYLVTVIHNHYLIMLIEVGAIGFLLLYGFFAAAAMTAVRWMRAAPIEMKLLLVGLVCAMAGVAVHNLGDPFGGHMSIAMLWLYAGLAFAACRRVQAERVLPARLGALPIQGLPVMRLRSVL